MNVRTLSCCLARFLTVWITTVGSRIKIGLRRFIVQSERWHVELLEALGTAGLDDAVRASQKRWLRWRLWLEDSLLVLSVYSKMGVLCVWRFIEGEGPTMATKTRVSLGVKCSVILPVVGCCSTSVMWIFRISRLLRSSAFPPSSRVLNVGRQQKRPVTLFNGCLLRTPFRLPPPWIVALARKKLAKTNTWPWSAHEEACLCNLVEIYRGMWVERQVNL